MAKQIHAQLNPPSSCNTISTAFLEYQTTAGTFWQIPKLSERLRLQTTCKPPVVQSVALMLHTCSCLFLDSAHQTDLETTGGL